jgi:hypothetical protein
MQRQPRRARPHDPRGARRGRRHGRRRRRHHRPCAGSARLPAWDGGRSFRVWWGSLPYRHDSPVHPPSLARLSARSAASMCMEAQACAHERRAAGTGLRAADGFVGALRARVLATCAEQEVPPSPRDPSLLAVPAVALPATLLALPHWSMLLAYPSPHHCPKPPYIPHGALPPSCPSCRAGLRTRPAATRRLRPPLLRSAVAVGRCRRHPHVRTHPYPPTTSQRRRRRRRQPLRWLFAYPRAPCFALRRVDRRRSCAACAGSGKCS